ncbi:MAG: methyltransferase domain-containing protein [Candidatus Margulisbacteria bacterium]|jgi:SAM-dependent methyltransferase|nr:methyltransferase domain-containing protein [Candidatus Margulisiibacteriota bacterium]
MTEIDYTDFDYKKIFWEKGDRRYEDFADRLALRRLLPKTGEKFLDVCGGFGRLADEYLGRYTEVCLFDYAENLLKQARAAHSPKLKTAQGSVYALPFADGEFDALIMVRAAHHLADFPAAIAETARVLKPGGRAVVEIANKRNLLEILRWCLGRSQMRPFALEPTSRGAKGVWNFHPLYAEQVFRESGLRIKKSLSVSGLRFGPLKKILGRRLLCALEYPSQRLGMKLTPSLYYLLEKPNA